MLEEDFAEWDDSDAFFKMRHQNRRERQENSNKMVVSNRSLKSVIFPLTMDHSERSKPRRKHLRKPR
jgi:hypothetical protein